MYFYTGIGSRQTPTDVQEVMTELARLLDRQGYILRSGHADGADKAFEAGATRKEIFLPWAGFNGGGGDTQHHVYWPCERSQKIAAEHHPNWGRCSPAARKLHGRNVWQVLGRELDTPSAFVVCWTAGGKLSGGTAQAIRIAKTFKVPVVNLGGLDIDYTGTDKAVTEVLSAIVAALREKHEYAEHS